MPASGTVGLGDFVLVPRPLPAAVIALVAGLMLGSCDKGSRQDRFCGRLTKDQALLSVVPADPDELDDFVQRYQDLAEVAPLAIEDQWRTITDLVEAVATEDLSDPTAADRLRDRAVAASRPIEDVREYARATCGVELVVLATPGATSTAPGSATTQPGTTSTTLAQPGTVPPVAP